MVSFRAIRLHLLTKQHIEKKKTEKTTTNKNKGRGERKKATYTENCLSFLSCTHFFWHW